ncbi:toxin co-regulated pilus biosynthesis Q family protein [Actimicrobium antarcticum]|uniref:Toxin co-regulated pilus biosynthesis protein Q C-terminal domain-containing protein n=1 Tax=Actimicrobium antarcticum TaxID=1051899 RepID=A0ABP7TAK2_9BURK
MLCRLRYRAAPPLFALLLAGTCLGVGDVATAATVAATAAATPATTETSWRKERFHYRAKGHSLKHVLRQFAQAQHLQISIDDSIDGQFTENLDLPAQQVLTTLAEQYHFAWRLNGKRLRIEKLPARADGGLALRSTDTQQFMNVDGMPTPVSATESATAPAPPEPPLLLWSTTPADRTLQNALARWSLTAGWQLVWELPQDFSIEAAASIKGSFEDAVAAVTGSLQFGDAPVTAIFYEGNRVLRIVAKGAQ